MTFTFANHVFSFNLFKMWRFMPVRKYCIAPLDFTKYCIEVFDKNGFGNVISKAKVIKAGPENFLVDLKVEEEYLNKKGTLHGGFTATLIDCLCTYALMTHKLHEHMPSVTTNMHLMYLKAAGVGDDIQVDINFTHVGKKLAFMNCEVRSKNTNSLLVKSTLMQTSPVTSFV